MSDPTRKCSRCGANNNPDAIYCVDCKESLWYYDLSEEQGESMALPRESSDISSSSCPEHSFAQLECLSQPEFIFQLESKEDGSIVGRQGDINITCLDNSSYISRKHVRFFYHEGRWLVEPLSQLNPTYINGIEIPEGNPLTIHDGDKVTLANTPFLFREVGQ